jgi:hypothetical protein
MTTSPSSDSGNSSKDLVELFALLAPSGPGIEPKKCLDGRAVSLVNGNLSVHDARPIRKSRQMIWN